MSKISFERIQYNNQVDITWIFLSLYFIFQYVLYYRKKHGQDLSSFNLTLQCKKQTNSLPRPTLHAGVI